MQNKITVQQILPEIVFSASRSGGAGGQNVNKVNTKITLRFSIENSQLLSDEEKELLKHHLQKNLTDAGELLIIAQEKRTQLENKRLAIAKLQKLIDKCYIRKKKRIATKATKASQQKRLESKKRNSEKKRNRSVDF